MNINDCEERIDKYLELQKTRPELFEGADGKLYPLELDREKLIIHEKTTGKRLGLVFHNEGYWMVLADLIKNGSRYCRVIYENRESNGCVILPVYEGGGEPLIGVLENFRHAPRCVAYELPRGFMKNSAHETTVTELEEELGISASQISELRPLGKVSADSGLCSGSADVYLVRIAGGHPRGNIGHEGIKKLHWLNGREFEKKIGSEIRDGFTMSAYLMWKTKK